jgi:hypothetical protein
MSKSEVYSWRLTPELKAELEAAARAEKTSVSQIIEGVVRDWLATRERHYDKDEQARIDRKLEACFGVFEGDGTSATNERIREIVGERIRAKHARRSSAR